MKGQETSHYFYNEHLTDEAIALIADAIVFNKEEMLPSILLDHAKECRQCKKEILGVYEILQQDDAMKHVKSHPFFGNIGNNKVNAFYIKKRYLIQIAAMFILLIGFGGVLFLFVKPGKISNYVKQQSLITDSLKQAQKYSSIDNHKKNSLVNKEGNQSIKKDELALNMVKSDFFENLIASQNRSEDIEIVSPTIAQQYTFPATVRFRFKIENPNFLTLLIYNNREKKLFEKNSISSASYTLEAHLSPGLYYWKLLKDNDLVHVGKFIIN
jgi:hypothetical protein